MLLEQLGIRICILEKENGLDLTMHATEDVPSGQMNHRDQTELYASERGGKMLQNCRELQ